jgi:predicted ATPase/serine phosphatase RsbU (regulator of sigma subunit)/tRNA A-37 threonylcarbamoyl transferase component Bud32
MLSHISGYRITETLHLSVKSIVYLAARDSDGSSVVIKTLNEAYPNHQQIARFLHEVEIHKKLNNIQGVASVYKVENHGHQQALVLEYISGGELAKQLNRTAGNFIELFFKSAIQIADTLSAIHLQGIIHKDIKPKNILWEPDAETIKIIDFSIASESVNEKHSHNSSLLTGSLPFLSPEQTGRMNRSVDYRSDFYSLGVTFYKLLSGEFPFDVSENDPMAWVHCHIARTPKPLMISEPAIAPALSAIINKLMAKNAEERYQSALGLKNDLQHCYSQWQSTGAIGTFIAGQMDVIDRFDIPQKLYGREQEVALLSDAFAEVARGDCQIFLVNGFSGIGKSVLINEIHKPIVAKNGYFISGKFDQFQRNIPYSALAQALRGLMQQLLTEPSERLYQWRSKLLSALGTNGQVLIDFIPELEQIIGEQPPVPHLGTEENQNRFNYVALQFLQLFAHKKHPLVLFIDDLQWMDSASLHLIKLFMLSDQLSYFLLLGAYRDNEVDAYHPLMLMIDELKKAKVNVFDLTLKPLQLSCINQLVSESIYTDAEKTLPLAEAILRKTDGNPFFINQFLKQSVETGLLVFDVQQKSWQWDLDSISQQASCDNVVDLMVAKMARLSPVTQNLLRLSACIGSVFDLHTLAIISEKTVQQVASELWSAVTAGLLIAQGDEHSLLKGISEHSTVAEQDFPNAVDKFLHDRVQQAAYSLIADDQKQTVHLKIGRLLLQNTPESELDNVCFDIVEHYNKSIALLTDDAELYRLAELNLMAGQKAKEATAYHPALRYFKKATSCLLGIQAGALPSYQALRFAAEKGQIECHFLLSEIDAGLQQADALLEMCQNVTDKVELNNLLILYYGGAGQMDKAIDIALDSLRLFAMNIPRSPNQVQLLAELARAKLKLGRKTAEHLSALPLIQDDKVHAVFSLLKELIAPTYLQGLNQLLPYIILRMFNLTLTHGNGPVSSFAYSGYALLWSKLGDFAEAHRFGVLAMDYNKHIDNPPMEARCYFMSTSFALYWGEALENSQQPRKIGLQKLIDTGEYFWASYIYLFGFWQEVVLSTSLSDLIDLSKKEQQFAHKAKQTEPYYVHTLHHNLFKNLAGQNDTADSLDDQYGEEADALGYFAQNATSTMGVFYHVVCRLVLHYSYEQYDSALAIATQPHITDEVIRDGTYTRVIYTFYSCLSMLAIIKSQTPFGLRKAKYHVDYIKHKRTIKKWYTLCPENFAVMWYLLRAEEARIAGNNTRAIDYYDLALSAAKANKSLWFESLVNELTAKFWLQKHKQKIAAVFMTEASYLYYRWGALRKVALLEKNYLELLSRQKSNADFEQGTLDYHTTSSTNSDFALDIHTLLKASQTLSGEIVMEKLLQKLMHFLIENAGAQRGVLILKEQDGYVIEAECTIEQEQEVINQQSVALADATNLSLMIVRYVLRSKETVLLGDTFSDQRFINDSYLQQGHVKSVLCLPLLDKGLLSGILYLENNIANNAFTPDRVEILQILSAEIAISLENARLYRQLAEYNQTLEETVRERTADLRAVNESLQNKNSEIQQATKIIEEKNNNITKSILYAQKIQAAMLPQAEKIAEELPEYFILFRPKEIVSGDFYWCNHIEGKLFVIVGDCTGHGVPGAFLSTIGHMLLNKIILEKRIFNPALILAVLHEEIKMALRQQGKSRQANDGMDIAICQIDFTEQLILYAGARRPMYLVKASNNELIKIAGDRKSIGGRQKEEMRYFADHALTFSCCDMLYLTSDGLADQHNQDNKKFSSLKLEATLRAIADKDIATQQQSLIQALNQHQGNEHQRDDITLFAMRLATTASHHHFNKEKNVQSFDLLSFRKLLIENNIVLSFEGKMSQGVLIALVETLKERLATNTDDATQHIIRKIYGVFVELAQNIQNHSLEKVLINQQKIGVGIIVIREDEGKFIITSGNKLLNVDAEKLRSYCDMVNALGEDELKKMYKEKLRMARQQDVVGAGIGLIDIIRKSNHPIVYTLQAVDETTQFFTLSVTLFKTIS